LIESSYAMHTQLSRSGYINPLGLSALLSGLYEQGTRPLKRFTKADMFRFIKSLLGF